MTTFSINPIRLAVRTESLANNPCTKLEMGWIAWVEILLQQESVGKLYSSLSRKPLSVNGLIYWQGIC